ncbi:MAG: glycoside hydrolase domain-containing protein [Planctomycetota bacterium]
MIAAFVVLAGGARAEVLRLDFGGGAVRDGWERVSPDDARWSGAKGFEEHVELPEYEALVREEKHLRVYPNELTCDFVGGLEEATFTVKAAGGTSRCWVLFGFGDDRYNPERPWYFDTRIAINGEARGTVRLTSPAVFVQRVFDCAPRDGEVAFTFSTDRAQWMVAAMILYGDGDAKEVADEVAAITEEIEFLPPALASRWLLRERLEKETLAELTKDERDRGYVVFHRSYASEVYPDSRPTRAEIEAGVKGIATPGEFEPLTFSIHPLTDKKVESVTAELPGTTLRIERVVYQRVREGGYNSAISGRYRVEPSYLTPIDEGGVTLKKDTPVRFWITARVGEDTPPGVKRGEATVAFDDATTCRVPLALEVLPFRLEKDPTITYSVYYDTRAWFFFAGNWPGHPRRDVLAKMTMDQTRAHLADLRDHGMNAIAPPIAWTVKDGKPAAAAVDRSNMLFALYREYGLDAPGVWWRMNMPEVARAAGAALRDDPNPRGIPKKIDDPRYVEFVRDLIRAMEAERKKNGWPEIIYAPVDEPGTREEQDFTKLVCGVVKETGARSYCTMKWWLTKEFSDAVDIRCYGTSFNPGNEHSETNWPEATGREENTRAGQEFWVYPNVLTCGSGVSPAFGRFWYGFYGLKIGLQGYNPWHHANWPGNPFNDFDSFYNGGRFVLPGPEGPLSTVAYEGAREGIDDMRYVYTLRQGIARAAVAGDGESEAAQEAHALLAEIKEGVPKYRDWIMGYAHRGIPTSKMLDDPKMRSMWEPLRPPQWPAEKMEEYRERIARAIVKLAQEQTKVQ